MNINFSIPKYFLTFLYSSINKSISIAEPGPMNNSVLGLTDATGIFLNTVALPFSSTKVCLAFGIQLVTEAPSLIKNVISVIDGEAGSCGKAKVIGEIATDKSIFLPPKINQYYHLYSILTQKTFIVYMYKLYCKIKL